MYVTVINHVFILTLWWQSGHTTMSVKLPYDLEEEILSRVPWKFLAKLRCVCKLWNSLILEERLNKKNLSFHMHNYSGEHRFILKDSGPKICAVGIEEQKTWLIPRLWSSKTLPLQKSDHSIPPVRAYKIVHCDGLLLCVMDNQLLLRNPLLKETSWIKCGSDFHQRDDAYSLGYLSHCDYRILRFRCAINSRNRPSRVEVCEVASKTWKVIDKISFGWFLSERHCRSYLWEELLIVQSYDFSRKGFSP